MPRQVRILVATVNGDTEIFTQRMLDEMKVNDEDVPLIFQDSGYWMSFMLKDAKFGDQQAVIRDCITRDGLPDDSLEPQKRFVRAVEPGSWTKQAIGRPEKELLSVSEGAFLDLDPPGLGNAINGEILRDWYPGATKTRDFIKAWQERQAKLEKEQTSMSTPSTPES